MNNSKTYRRIIEWETAINGRSDIEFEEIQLKNRGVIGVNGYIVIQGKRRRVQWLHDGRCYHNGRRVSSYDIAL